MLGFCEEVVRDPESGACGKSPPPEGSEDAGPKIMFCEPLYRYDVIKVFSPTLVDELLQDENYMSDLAVGVAEALLVRKQTPMLLTRMIGGIQRG